MNNRLLWVCSTCSRMTMYRPCRHALHQMCCSESINECTLLFSRHDQDIHCLHSILVLQYCTKCCFNSDALSWQIDVTGTFLKRLKHHAARLSKCAVHAFLVGRASQRTRKGGLTTGPVLSAYLPAAAALRLRDVLGRRIHR